MARLSRRALHAARNPNTRWSSSSLLLSSLELSDTTICQPYIRALLGTASHFCEAVVLTLRTVPLGTAEGRGTRVDGEVVTEGVAEPNGKRPKALFYLYGRVTARAEDAQGTPAQSHVSPSKRSNVHNKDCYT